MLNREGCTGGIELLGVPKSRKVNQLFSLPVRITNTSQINWYGIGVNDPVCLSYHWTTDSGEVLVFDGIRSPVLDGGVKAGYSVEQLMRVQAPGHLGVCRLEITLVWERNFWFDEPCFKVAILDLDIQD